MPAKLQNVTQHLTLLVMLFDMLVQDSWQCSMGHHKPAVCPLQLRCHAQAVNVCCTSSLASTPSLEKPDCASKQRFTAHAADRRDTQIDLPSGRDLRPLW